jgi:hypothetical protein
MSASLNMGSCDHCHQSFGYFLIHAGFGDCVYAYCSRCGKTAILSMWDKQWRLPNDCAVHQEICCKMEKYVQACECGGTFKRGAKPRCSHCHQPLSAELATSYIEKNAPGTAKGWRWQQNWSGTYCIVIENQLVENNFLTPQS